MENINLNNPNTQVSDAEEKNKSIKIEEPSSGTIRSTSMYNIDNNTYNTKPENLNQETKLGVIMQELSKQDALQNGYLQAYGLRTAGLGIHPSNSKSEPPMHTPADTSKYTTYASEVNNHIVPIFPKETNDKSFNCNTCDYETNVKRFLSSGAPTAAIANKCTSCYFETPTSDDMKKFTFIHNETIDHAVFKDTTQKYVQKRKTSSASEGKWFTCETCFYETKYKYRLNQHVKIMHRSAADVVRVKCTVCEFQTKFKESLKRHMLIHGDPSEIPMHKCSMCMFQTKLKVSLKRHMLIHADPSELEMHKCTVCVFQTKFKDSLKRHMNTHLQKAVKNGP